MIAVVGLALLCLTLYMSTLAYTLRDYSRGRLTELLSESAQKRWLDWLDRYESELQALAGFVRVTANLGVLVGMTAWYLRDSTQALGAADLIPPGLLTLVLLLVFAIGIPHGLAMHAGEEILARSLVPLWLLRILLYPVARAASGIEFIIRRLLGRPEQTVDAESERVEQEILDAVSEGEAAGAVDEDQRDLIESVFEFADTDVGAIMTPRTDINAIQGDTTYEDARAAILRGGHSRVPVYETSIDHIIGVLYAKDLLRLNPGGPFDVRQIMRVPPYVPETKSIHALLEEFRERKVQIAIVLDEYGGTAGLVTLEDILEELVGEISDEYDQAPPPAIERIDGNTVDVDARVHVDEINEELGIELPEEGDYETIGGFVFSTLGKIPAAGEEFKHDHVHFRVMSAEPRKINRLRISVEREKAETA